MSAPVETTPPVQHPVRPALRRSLAPVAAHVIASLLARLPRHTRTLALDELGRQVRAYDVFKALGKGLHVRDIRVDGEYGLIQGALADAGVMAGYATGRHWGGEINRMLLDFFAEHRRGTYIDIGANLGLTTIPVARFPRVKCWCFEPEPLNYRYLSINVAEHCRHANVELMNVALLDRNGTVDFEIDPENHGDHRIAVPCDQGRFDEQLRPVISVAGRRLDDVFAEAPPPGPIVVKIDTQGSEALIIAGGRKTIAAATWMVTEFWPYSLQRTGCDIELVAGLIEGSFREGAIVPGDQDAAPDWAPIGAIAARLRALMGAEMPGPFTYFEVYARK